MPQPPVLITVAGASQDLNEAIAHLIEDGLGSCGINCDVRNTRGTPDEGQMRERLKQLKEKRLVVYIHQTKR
jgi:hypothetical protein